MVVGGCLGGSLCQELKNVFPIGAKFKYMHFVVRHLTIILVCDVMINVLLRCALFSISANSGIRVNIFKCSSKSGMDCLLDFNVLLYMKI